MLRLHRQNSAAYLGGELAVPVDLVADAASAAVEQSRIGEISILSGSNRVARLPSGLGHESPQNHLFTQDHITRMGTARFTREKPSLT